MAKAKGKEKLAASEVPSKVEEATGDDAIAESAPSESVDVEEATTAVLDKSEEGDKKEDSKDNGKVESTATDVISEGEKMEEGDMTEEVKDDGKGERASNKKAKRIKKRKKKAAASAAASNDADKPGTSAAEKKKKKDLQMADGMGLIFMCNAKTKKDCFRYKVLGLPAGKKEVVAKVYKGMRLFLFDIDLKLMYGIYKAASPGGYNIEPKAFKSAFPSQVRFTVLNDCLPLPEEKFKAAIKANYYGRNKFNCQLSPEQVKNLCKLFRTAGKTSKKSGEAVRAEPVPSSTDRDQKRRPRHERARLDRIIPRGRDLYTRRESYASPPLRQLALPPPLPPPSYAYDRPVDDYYYRTDPLPLGPRDHRIIDLEMRPRQPIEYRDPYSLYREPLPYRDALYPPASLPSATYAPPPPLYYRY